MFLCFRPILFLTFVNSLICVGSLIEKFYIQTVPGTKHHRFLVSLIFLLHLSFFRHNERLRRVEHLQRKETLSSEPYFRRIQRCILACHSSISTGKKTGKTHLCVLQQSSHLVPKTGFKKLRGQSKHTFILIREFEIVTEWQLTFLPKTMNYFNNDKTNHYYYIRTNSLNKILGIRYSISHYVS